MIGLDPTFPVMVEALTSVMPVFVNTAKLPAVPTFTGAGPLAATNGVVSFFEGGAGGGLTRTIGFRAGDTGGSTTGEGTGSITGERAGGRTACRPWPARCSLALARCSPQLAATAVVPTAIIAIT